MEGSYIETEQLGNNRERYQNHYDMANLKTVYSDPHVADLLKKAGFTSVKDLFIRGALGISESTGLDIRRSICICDSARRMLEETGVIKRCLLCASGLCNCYYNTERISTWLQSSQSDPWRRNRDKLHYTDIWSIQFRKDPAVPYIVCNGPTRQVN